jgi:hypothetical protein
VVAFCVPSFSRIFSKSRSPRRALQFKARLRRPQLATGEPKLDCDYPAGHVGPLPQHAPLAYSGPAVAFLQKFPEHFR